MDEEPDYADTLEFQMIVDYMAGGMTLIDACRTLGLHRQRFYERKAASARAQKAFDEARDDGHEVIANDIRKVTRGEAGYSSGDPKRDKLIAETDLKLLAVWQPRKYGPRIQVESKSATVAIPASDDPVAAQRAYEQLMKES